MPKYSATNTAVSLLVSPLAASTGPIQPRRCVKATKSSEEAQAALRSGIRLHEEVVKVPTEDGRMSFLPQAEAPFFMVAASVTPLPSKHENVPAGTINSRLPNFHTRDVSGVSASSISTLSSLASSTFSHKPDYLRLLKSAEAPDRAVKNLQIEQGIGTNIAELQPRVESAPLSHQQRPISCRLQNAQAFALPQALAVQVDLSRKSFKPSFTGMNPHKPQDLKIEVFVNGAFADCATVPARYISETAHHKPLLSGSRCEKVVSLLLSRYLKFSTRCLLLSEC